MTVEIRYFAWVRERVGTEAETLDLPEGTRTVSDLLSWLKSRDERYAYAFEDTSTIRVALDQEHSEHDQPIGNAREIAIFPPMTGG
ncbi:molybdopterin converting factor subunit 1 [Roseibium litorale]|uniref:Molybdopterin converting factor subunit 1 n=1 Tax=Roseibium litorale TaxID=2803841 RepID=A0ABR9CKN2_9HYPH|nr:molybdopterin converting factor subunit 1 [Roseibium litorale]MBD8891410.1 molybdopterin converting factor subunit 1 [Roseibium litorale]